MCNEWVEALNQPGFAPKEKSMVCCAHFAEEDWSQTSIKKRRLKWWAKPSRMLAKPNSEHTASMVRKKDKERYLPKGRVNARAALFMNCLFRVAFLRHGCGGPLLLTVCGPGGQQLRYTEEADEEEEEDDAAGQQQVVGAAQDMRQESLG